MSHRVGNGALITGAHVVSSNGGLGILVENIPSTGYAHDSLQFPTDNGKEIRGEITSGPTVISGAGTITTFFAYEDTDYDLTVSGDCTVEWTWSLYVDGVLDTAGLTATVSIGAVAFTAVNAESAAEVSTPAFGQDHALAATSVESATEASAPVIGQNHVLTGVSVESTTETGQPVIGQNYILSATDAESSTEVAAPLLGHGYAFSAVDAEAATEVFTPYVIPRPAGYKITFFTVDFAGLDSNSPLAGNSAYSALLAGDAILYEGTSPESSVDWSFSGTGALTPTPSSFSVDQTCDFQIWDASDETIGNAGTITVDATATSFTAVNVDSASEVVAPALGQNHQFTPTSIEASSEVTAPALSQLHQFTVVNAESASEVTNPALSTVGDFVAVDAESATEVSTPAYTQIQALLANAVEINLEVSSPALTADGTHTLTATDAEIANETGTPLFGQLHVLSVVSAEATSELSNPLITIPGAYQIPGFRTINIGADSRSIQPNRNNRTIVVGGH